jgi:hypothetical protein
MVEVIERNQPVLRKRLKPEEFGPWTVERRFDLKEVGTNHLKVVKPSHVKHSMKKHKDFNGGSVNKHLWNSTSNENLKIEKRYSTKSQSAKTRPSKPKFIK